MGGGVGGKVEKGGGEEEGDGEMDCCWVEGMTWGLLDKEKDGVVAIGQERGVDEADLLFPTLPRQISLIEGILKMDLLYWRNCRIYLEVRFRCVSGAKKEERRCWVGDVAKE